MTLLQASREAPDEVTNTINEKLKSYRRRISPSLGPLARPGGVQRVRRLARVGELGALLGDHDEMVLLVKVSRSVSLRLRRFLREREKQGKSERQKKKTRESNERKKTPTGDDEKNASASLSTASFVCLSASRRPTLCFSFLLRVFKHAT